MQKGRTFAVAWAVLASAALPALPARADSTSALNPAASATTLNPLNLENGNTFVLDVTDVLPLPLPGTKKLGINLETLTGKLDDLNLSLQSNDIAVGGGTASVGFSGNVGAVEADWRSLNLGVQWSKDLAPGQKLDFSAGTNLYGDGVGMLRLNITLNPDVAAPAANPDMDWRNGGVNTAVPDAPNMWEPMDR